MKTITARAHPNIAFIKYWGNRNDALRLPANPSLSMNLDGLYTQTTVIPDETLSSDVFILNGEMTAGKTLERVINHLNILRQRCDVTTCVRLESANNFPTGTGIASSAAAFAALTVAAAAAFEANLTERELTTLARCGSGSAARSVPAGFVEWHDGDTHEESFAESIAPPDYWQLVDVIAIVSETHKATGSQEGHTTAATSDLQNARVSGAAERLARCKQALLARDFAAFAEVVELDSNLMHAVMMTSRPPLFYWLPATLAIIQQVRLWRLEGLNVCYTLDAGPNVHCLCTVESAPEVQNQLRAFPGVVDIKVAAPGGGAFIIM